MPYRAYFQEYYIFETYQESRIPPPPFFEGYTVECNLSARMLKFR